MDGKTVKDEGVEGELGKERKLERKKNYRYSFRLNHRLAELYGEKHKIPFYYRGISFCYFVSGW